MNLELKQKWVDGRFTWVSTNKYPFRNQAGETIGTFGIARDITDSKEAKTKLEYLSTHDSLTGLYNRAFFDEEVNRYKLGRQFPISIVMADVDGLKDVNDKSGHQAGDKLIRRTAQVFNDSFRGDDIIARIGGDEFTALLPNTDKNAAKKALKRILSNLQKNNAHEIGSILSISLGISTAEKGAELKNAIQEADKEMYQNKNKKKSK
jgi:diguanylate cyclase (GGDEF)-like protein